MGCPVATIFPGRVRHQRNIPKENAAFSSLSQEKRHHRMQFLPTTQLKAGQIGIRKIS
jgi:hypothetical protein